MESIPLWLQRALNYWGEHVDNYGNGCFEPDLDSFLINIEEIDLFIDICEKVFFNLNSFGDKIPKEYINSIGNFEHSYKVLIDNDTEIYLVFGRALINLLKGEQSLETINV